MDVLETDSLTGLEERILKAVETVGALKREKEALEKRVADAVAGEQAARAELENLRGEQKKVRSRIEKLLGQIDALTAG